VQGAVTVKDGVSVIPAQAFQYCSMQTLVLPESVKTIETSAFNSCGALEDVTLAADVTLGNSAFSWCGAVKSVRFIGTGAMSDFTDTRTWSPWYSGSYSNNHDLTVEIAQGVTSIGKNVFNGCGRLQSVTVPLSVKRVDNYAFYNCSTLNIYYAGSETQWGGVEKTLTKSTLGNTGLVMHYGSATELVITAPDGRTLYSGTLSDPTSTFIYVVGYNAGGKMTMFQTKTIGESLTFAVTDTQTAKIRVLAFGENFAPVSASADIPV